MFGNNSPASRSKIICTSFVGGSGVIEVVNYQLVALFASVLLNAYDSRTAAEIVSEVKKDVQAKIFKEKMLDGFSHN